MWCSIDLFFMKPYYTFTDKTYFCYLSSPYMSHDVEGHT